ncbi:MAG: tetratricopeptide repeat protein, partial [Endomicrobia bacterium]|nr:tetratricopeptide repeat protein [Endomicrobiia bacterium]
KIAIVFFLAACILSTSAFVHSREYENKRAPQPDTVNKEIIYDAIIHYKNGLMQNPGDATLLMKYADAYEALGDANKAAEIRRRILPQNAKNGAAEQSPEER